MATSHPPMDVIYRAINEDYRALINDVLNETSVSSYSRSLKSDMASLSVSDGLVLLDSPCIVLPLSAVKPVLKLLHASHSGINKTIVLARGLYFCPGMINYVKQLISSCHECAKLLQSQPANPMITAPPSHHFGYPMQHVGLDLFSFGGKSFLICVDHWSKYPLYHALRSLSSDAINSILVTWFNTLGWPSSIRSDGAPSSAEISLSFVPNMVSRTNCHHPTTPRGTVWRKRPSNLSRTFCAKVMPQVLTLLRCSMRGRTCPGMMDRAPPSYLLAYTTFSNSSY